jgi:hypothetical protein
MADNINLTAGTGPDKAATDEIGGAHYQRVKVNFGADGSATDVSAAAPLPTEDTGVWWMLQRIYQVLIAPLGYDKSLQRQRSTAIIESGTVTTVSTVSTVTTVTGLTNIDGRNGSMLINQTNLSAWADCVRARIT